jgi:hypothetical protein
LRRIVTLPIEGDPAALLIIGFGTSGVLTTAELRELENLAEQARLLLTSIESPTDEIERLRRLEAAERLLPAFLDVLDVRQIFDRLSAITKNVVRHDFASVGVFSENLTQLTLFATTSTLRALEYKGPLPYPPSQTTAWLCRYVRDLPAHPIDGKTDFAVKQRGRSSIRVAIRDDDRVLGALNFTSRDPEPYTSLDLTIARRVADYVALGISINGSRRRAGGRQRSRSETRSSRCASRRSSRSLTREPASGAWRANRRSGRACSGKEQKSQ